MAIYTASKTVKTLTLHKDNCRVIKRDKLDPCGCGITGKESDQRWFCERHMSIDAVNEFMNGKFWSILLCDLCYRE